VADESHSLDPTTPFSVMVLGGGCCCCCCCWLASLSGSTVSSATFLSAFSSDCATALADFSGVVASGMERALGGRLRAQWALVTLDADREMRCSSDDECRYKASPAFVKVRDDMPLQSEGTLGLRRLDFPTAGFIIYP
jgi:hypothetical protein